MPLPTSYIAPTMPISPFFSIAASVGLCSRIDRMVSSTWIAVTRSTNGSFLLSRLSRVSVSARTASLIGSVIAGRLVRPVAATGSMPLCTKSQVAFTAPQRVWPSTTTSLLPTILQANSMLPIAFALATLPATRTEKMSPMPRSNSSSAGARESMQLRMIAIGCWPSEVASTCRARSRCRRWPLRNRSLPSRSSSSTRCGVSAACTSRDV